MTDTKRLRKLAKGLEFVEYPTDRFLTLLDAYDALELVMADLDKYDLCATIRNNRSCAAARKVFDKDPLPNRRKATR